MLSIVLYVGVPSMPVTGISLQYSHSKSYRTITESERGSTVACDGRAITGAMSAQSMATFVRCRRPPQTDGDADGRLKHGVANTAEGSVSHRDCHLHRHGQQL